MLHLSLLLPVAAGMVMVDAAPPPTAPHPSLAAVNLMMAPSLWQAKDKFIHQVGSKPHRHTRSPSLVQPLLSPFAAAATVPFGQQDFDISTTIITGTAMLFHDEDGNNIKRPITPPAPVKQEEEQRPKLCPIPVYSATNATISPVLLLYQRDYPGANLTTPLTLYHYCFERIAHFIPRQFATVWECIAHVDQLHPCPIADARLQLAYPLIDTDINGYWWIYFGAKRLTDISLFIQLIDSIKWPENHQNAMLHYTAFKSRPSELRATHHALFLNLHQHFCHTETTIVFSGICLASLITYCPVKALCIADSFISSASSYQRPMWKLALDLESRLFRMYTRNSGSLKAYTLFLEILLHYLANRGNVNLKWFTSRRHFNPRLFTAQLDYGKEFLRILIQFGIYVDALSALVHRLVEVRSTLDESLIRLILSTGADVLFHAPITSISLPMEDRKYLESISIETLKSIKAYSGDRDYPLIGVYASLTEQRARALVESGLTTVNAVHVSSGQSSLYYSISAEVAQYLLQSGADMNHYDFSGLSLIDCRRRWRSTSAEDVKVTRLLFPSAYMTRGAYADKSFRWFVDRFGCCFGSSRGQRGV